MNTNNLLITHQTDAEFEQVYWHLATFDGIRAWMQSETISLDHGNNGWISVVEGQDHYFHFKILSAKADKISIAIKFMEDVESTAIIQLTKEMTMTGIVMTVDGNLDELIKECYVGARGRLKSI